MEPSTLQNNLAIIKKRWPELYCRLEDADPNSLHVIELENTLLINGIQLCSNYNRAAEAALQAGSVSALDKTVTVYGPAVGDLPRALLQKREALQLQIVLLNRAVFLYSLAFYDQQDWLEHPAVSLLFPLDMMSLHTPFCCSPAELILAEEATAPLRDRIEQELNLEFSNRRHITSNAIGQQQMRACLPFLQQDSSISKLSSPENPEIFVAAAGPTLETHFEYLKENNVYLIAVDAALRALLPLGIIPDIVVSIDSIASHLFSGLNLSSLAHTPLVYFPGADTKLLKQWPGPRFFSCGNTAMYDTVPDQFKTPHLFSAGSVIHPAVDLAVYLGAKKITLLGADFSFTKSKSHASATHSQESLLTVERARHQVTSGQGKQVGTTANFKSYLRDLEVFIHTHQEITFLNGSCEGARIAGTTPWKDR